MLRKAVAAFCALLLVAGCGRVGQVDPTTDSQAVAEINERAANGIAEIELVGGRTIHVTRFRIDGDTATWRWVVSPEKRVSAPVADVRSIRVPAAGGGAGRTIVGVGLGLVGGALLGVATLPVPDPEEGGVAVVTDLALAPARVALVAVLGGLVGGIIGASMRPKEVFELTVRANSARAVEDTIDAALGD